jgi:endonuclease YncB( thermonuclease family)
MGFTLIKGAFHLDAGVPDGDSVRFLADDDSLFDRLRGRRVGFKDDGTVQLRYEGIDTVEKAAVQPLANDSRDKNFELLRELDDPSANRPRGFILTRQTDVNRRPVSFAFAGDIAEADGADVFLDAGLLRRSVNYKMVASGFAYTMFYTSLFMEIRRELAAAYRAAKSAGTGLHPDDATLTGARVISRRDLATIPPIFPKLWRRLEEYFRTHSTLDGFLDWLTRRDSERLNTISDQRTAIAFDNVVAVDGDTVRLLYDADDMIFIPA